MGLFKSIRDIRGLTGQARQLQEQQQAQAGYEPGVRGMVSQMGDLVEVASGQLAQLTAQMQDESRILQTGLDADGLIVAMGVPARGAAQFNLDIDLEVRIAGRDPYRVANMYLVPASAALSPGAVLPIKVDAADLSKVAIDWERTEQHAARGEVRPSAAAADDPAARIRKLQELRAAGVITDDELAAQKQRILDAI